MTDPHRLRVGVMPAETIRVAMRDGAHLMTDVYLPGGPVRRTPAIVIRLPYDRRSEKEMLSAIARLFTGHGYAVVIQDTRGKFGSEGEAAAFVHEIPDGADTLDWVVEQAWSDGTAATFGDSYYGFTAWAGAIAGHPAVRAIVPRVTGLDVAGDWMYHGGVFRLGMMAEWAATTWVDKGLDPVVLDYRRPLSEVVRHATNGRRSAEFDAWIAHAERSPWWRRRIFGSDDPHGAVTVPSLLCGGWWDIFQRGMVRDWSILRRRPGPGSASHLVMRATDHEFNQFDESAAPWCQADEPFEVKWPLVERQLQPVLGFLTWAFGRGGQPPAPIAYEVARSAWHTDVSWPPADSVPLTLYLADVTNARRGPEGGMLHGTPDRLGALVHWDHDPGDLVPSLDFDPWQPLRHLPDERDIEIRDDVLTFTTEAFTDDTDVAGPIALQATVRSSAPTTAVMAKLVDVRPDGCAIRIAEGARHVDGRDYDRVVEVDLGHTAYRVGRGHSLRLEIMSSDFPRYLWNPGDGQDPWLAVRGTVAHQALDTLGTSLRIWTRRTK